MPLEIVVGAQWGDEGKGRIVDLLAEGAEIVARFNGGDNAGHTVTVGEHTFKLHLVPSGIIHPHTLAVLGSGVVINPLTLMEEIEMLRRRGVEVTPQRLKLSHAAHLITPGHRALDRAQEASRGRAMLGTTGRGIGPAYTDKTSRRGLRLQDLLDLAGFEDKLRVHLHQTNDWLTHIYQAEPLDVERLAAEYTGAASLIIPYINDVGMLLDNALQSNRRVLAEGAQGSLLDLDHGTYPYVTSSYTTAAGALIGLGLGVHPVERVIGVTKCFQTRVGSGPFPTEVSGAQAERLRGTGANPWDEYGTTTGRPRRVGWLDAVLLRYAVRINGLSELIVTKLDVLSGLEKVYICSAYRSAGREYAHLPMGPADLTPFEPVLEELPGWQEDIRAARRWEDLPAAAQNFVQRIAQLSGTPVRQVSVGPERSQIVDVLVG